MSIKFLNRVLVATSLLLTAAYPGEAASTLEKANEAYRNGDFYLSANLYRMAAREGESPALCYYNAANACFQIDSLAQAIVYYRACVQNAPAFFKGHLNLAVCYYSLDDMGQCLASLRTALNLEPTQRKALMIKAAALRSCGATAEAVATFATIVRLYPEQEEPYIALGEIYSDLDDPDEAIRWLEAYPTAGKNSSYVQTMLAGLYEKKGDMARAIYELGRAFSADTANRWTLYRIAVLQQQSGNELVALETCRRGASLFPDFSEIATLAGTIAFDHNRIDEAYLFFEKGAALGNPAAVVGLSNVRSWRKAHAAEP